MDFVLFVLLIVVDFTWIFLGQTLLNDNENRNANSWAQCRIEPNVILNMPYSSLPNPGTIIILHICYMHSLAQKESNTCDL